MAGSIQKAGRTVNGPITLSEAERKRTVFDLRAIRKRYIPMRPVLDDIIALIERNQPQEPPSEYAALKLSPDERRARMRKRAEGIIRQYPIPADDNTETKWPGGAWDSRLLADEVMAYLDQPQEPAEVCECGMPEIDYEELSDPTTAFCVKCGKPVREKE